MLRARQTARCAVERAGSKSSVARSPRSPLMRSCRGALSRITACLPPSACRSSAKPPLEPEFSCNPVPAPAAFNGADYDNGFEGFAVGSSSAEREGARLFFTVHAQNEDVEETAEPQVFNAYIDIVDVQTNAVLDTQDVVVIVPARPGGVGE